MSNIRQFTVVLVFAAGLVFNPVARADSLPPLPVLLDWWPFVTTNLYTHYEFLPVAQTNIQLASTWSAYQNALVIDSNSPAFAQYNVIESGGDVELACSAGSSGSLFWWFSPDWNSASEGGDGPSSSYAGQFLDAGVLTSGEWFSIYAAAGGNEMGFGSSSNGYSSTYVTTTIDWVSNTWHLIGVTYSPGSTAIYLDGSLAATGSGVSHYMDASTMSNGFFIGSDSTGVDQIRGQIFQLQSWGSILDASFFSNEYASVYPVITNWQNGGGSGGSDFSFGSLIPLGSGGGCATGDAVYVTNMTSTLTNGTNMTFTFTISGGEEGELCDVFATTNIVGVSLTNSTWTWLGRGTNCGTYAITNQSTNQAFYMLGAEMALDGSGLTVAYENLISTNAIGDTNGTPTAWYLNEGLNPQTIANIGIQDPDLDGLLNLQEYLYGTNPQVSEGFEIWTAGPAGISGIP